MREALAFGLGAFRRFWTTDSSMLAACLKWTTRGRLRMQLKLQSEPELINELLAGGAVAASVGAVASVINTKINANTERERIASEERKSA